MKYMLLIYGNEQAQAGMTEAEGAAQWAAYNDFTKDVVDRGLMQGGDALQPVSTATTVRVRGDETLTTDGPFAETKEQLGGYYLVECPSLDEAIEASSKLPIGYRGSVEIRPVMVFDEEDHPS